MKEISICLCTSEFETIEYTNVINILMFEFFHVLKHIQSLHPDQHDPSDKRFKLERSRSAAEKENQPLQRSGSLLRRQYSQQESSRRMSSEMSGPGGMDMMQDPSMYRMQQPQQQPGMTYSGGVQPGIGYQGQQQQQLQQQQQQPPSGYDGQQYGPGQTSGYYQPTEDPTFYQVSKE